MHEGKKEDLAAPQVKGFVDQLSRQKGQVELMALENAVVQNARVDMPAVADPLVEEPTAE